MKIQRLLNLASGWEVPSDDGKQERFVKALKAFSRKASEEEFAEFLVLLRKRAAVDSADYMFTVCPAVELFARNSIPTDGRSLAATMEALRAGHDEEAVAHFRRITKSGDFSAQLLLLLRPGPAFLPLGGDLAWELGIIERLRGERPGERVLDEARKALIETKLSLLNRVNERVYNKLLDLLYSEYERSFESLIRSTGSA